MEQLGYLTSQFSIGSAAQILAVGLVFQVILNLIRGTQTEVLIRGVLVVLVVMFVIGRGLQLELINWIVDNGLPVMMFAVIVVFQPEIRRLLERAGRTGSYVAHPFGVTTAEDTRRMIDQVVGAAEMLSARVWGALIVLQREGGLDEYAETGTRLEAALSRALVMTVFYPGSELHDGALIVQGTRALAAHAMLPLSDALGPQDHVGTRHRAGLGITEASDAVAVMVSEETGGIAFAADGRLDRHLTPDQLRRRLEAVFPLAGRSTTLQQSLPAWISRR